MPTFVKAKYTFAGDPSTNTPPFAENEHLTLIHKHDNGWLEIDTSAGVRGFVSPAWVDEVPEKQEAVVPDVAASPEVVVAAAAPAAAAAASQIDDDIVRPLQFVRSRSAMEDKAEKKGAAPLPKVPGLPESSTDDMANRKKTLTLEDLAPAVGALDLGPDEPPPPPPVDSGDTRPESPLYCSESEPEEEPPVTTVVDPVVLPPVVEEPAILPAVPEEPAVVEQPPVVMVSSATDDKAAESSKKPPPLARSRSPSARRSPSPEPRSKAPPAVKPRASSTDVIRNKIRSLSTSSADEQTKKLAAPAPKRRPMSNEFTSRLEMKLGGLAGASPDKKSPPVIPTRSDSTSKKAEDDSADDAKSDGSGTLNADGSGRRPHRPAPAPPANVKPVRPASRDRRTTSASKPRRQTNSSRPSDEDFKSPVKEDSQQQQQQQQQQPDGEVNRELMNRETMEGILDRKCLKEGGMSVKKRSWQTYFVTLIGTNMLFHSNEKAKKAGKDPLFTLDVSDKDVSPAVETKKKYAFVVGNESDRILLQASDDAGMRTWKEVLKTAKKSLSVTSPSDTSKGRRNTTPRKKKNPTEEEAAKLATSTSKDGGASPKPKYSYVRRKLKEYLSARPNKQELVSKGILEDAVFGGTLVHQVEKENKAFPNKGLPNIPLIVTTCIPKVEADITEQGIYRVSGNSASIQKLVGKANADPSFSIDSTDVHIVTGLLKLYFRELAEPVFTEDLYDDWIAAGKMQDKDERIKTMKVLLDQVPEENKATLKYLFEHLTNVAKYADVNKMQINNLAIVFGPTLLRQTEPSLESIVMDATYQSSCVEDILRNMDIFFP